MISGLTTNILLVFFSFFDVIMNSCLTSSLEAIFIPSTLKGVELFIVIIKELRLWFGVVFIWLSLSQSHDRVLVLALENMAMLYS